jgi:hypothetical protein
MKNKRWALIRQGAAGVNRYNEYAKNSSSSNRNTYSFKYTGGKLNAR